MPTRARTKEARFATKVKRHPNIFTCGIERQTTLDGGTRRRRAESPEEPLAIEIASVFGE
jgi:hypothetical protein